MKLSTRSTSFLLTYDVISLVKRPELSYQSLGIQEDGATQELLMEAVLEGKRDEEYQ